MSMSQRVTFSKRYKYLMVLMNNAGLSERQERLHVASRILGRRVETFTSLTSEDVEKLVFCFRNWKFIQEQRFTNGVMNLEALMLFDTIASDSKLKISDNDILSTVKSRRKFMDFYEITEKDYQSQESFEDVLSSITSKASRDIKVKKLTVDNGRWPTWKLVNPPTTGFGLATYIGGIPRGKIFHLWGQKHGGKSYLSYSMIAEAQRQGMYCILFDTEAAATGKLVENLGVDVDKLAVITPDDIEDLGNMLKNAVQHKNMFIVIDSIAASESGAELERDYNKAAKVAGNSQTWKSILNTSRAPLQDNGSTLVLINQVRRKMTANPYEYPFKAYGGESIHHNVDISARVEAVTEKNKTLKDKGYKISRLYFDKNRFGELTRADLVYHPGLPYDQAIDLVRNSSLSVTAGSNVTWGMLSDNTLLAGKQWDAENERFVSKKNRFVLRVDPWMMGALLADDPNFDEVDIEPDPNFDPHGEVPSVDIYNSTYFTLPGQYELGVSKTLSEMPHVMRVISERMLNSLDKVQGIIEDLAGVKKPMANESEIIDETDE